jgi:hypothetical protein
MNVHAVAAGHQLRVGRSLLQHHLAPLRAWYVALKSWLLLWFFHEPFTSSFVKNIFELSVLVPRRVIIGMQVTTAAERRGCAVLIPAPRQGAV